MIKLDQQPLVGKYRNYSSYSDSGVAWIGKVPAIWTLKRVKHMFTIRKRIAGELGYDILSVTQRGIVVKDIESGEGQLSMDYSKYQRVKPGDFAMNHMDLLTGYVDISNHDGVTSPDYRVFTLDNTDYSAKYFLYIFQMGYQLRLFFHMGQGASHFGRWRLATDEFNEMVFPVPSFEEQQSIAAFLDYETARIDRLIAKQQQLIELLKEKRQAVISHAVTKGLNPYAPMKDSGVEWLGHVPEHWASIRVKQVSTFITSGPRGWSDFISENGEEVFLQSGDLNNELGLDLDKAKRVTPPKNTEGVRTKLIDGDVVVCITGANTGRVAIVENLSRTTYINQHLSLIRPLTSKISSKYLGFSLASSGGRSFFDVVQYGLKEGLSLSNICEVPIALPPIDEQHQIAKHIESKNIYFDKLTSFAIHQVDLLRERRTALISAAVSGKIDLRGWTPRAEEGAA